MCQKLPPVQLRLFPAHAAMPFGGAAATGNNRLPEDNFWQLNEK